MFLIRHDRGIFGHFSDNFSHFTEIKLCLGYFYRLEPKGRVDFLSSLAVWSLSRIKASQNLKQNMSKKHNALNLLNNTT